MSDISKCSGVNCQLRHQCYRYTAPYEPLGQSYLLTPPFTIKNGVFSCSMFWGVAQTPILDKLKEIVRTTKQPK